MQFSVIIEGGMKGKEPPSDSWEELELYLRSAKIPPALVQQLQPGQPQVLKQQLSYEQAVSLSDHLADLGLDSAIDPPVKPEADAAATMQLIGSPPSAAPGARQRKTANAGKPGLAASPNPNPSPNIVKAVRSASKSPEGSKAPAVPAARPNTSGAAKQSPLKSPGKTPQQPSSPALGKAAREVRTLFNLPAKGKVNITLPHASRLRLWFLASYSILLLCLLVAVFLGAVLVIAALSIALHGTIASLSALAGSLFLIVFGTGCFAALGLLTLPFWLGSKQGVEPRTIHAKQDPRLAMLVTAVCKLVGAPSPSHIYLVPEAQLRASLSCTGKSFFALHKPLQGELALYLGSPVLASLSIAEFAALIARECGRFTRPSSQRSSSPRSYVIVMGILAWLQACRSRPTLDRKFSQINERLHSATMPRFIYKLLHRADPIQQLSFRAIDFCERRISALLTRHDRVADCYQAAVLGKDSAALQGRLSEIEGAHQRSVSSMLQDNQTQRFVDSLAALTGELYKQNQSVPSNNGGANGLVTSGQIASSLLDEFVNHDQQLTRAFYRSQGLDSKLRLMSVQALQRREQNEAKLRKIARHYYGNWLHSGQHWQLPSESFAEAAEQKILLSRLNHCVSRVRYLSPDRAQLVANYYTLQIHLTELKAAKKVVASGTAFRFRYCADAAEDLDKQIVVRAAKLKQYAEELRQHNAVMGERIALGLTLDRQHKTTILQIQRALNAIHSVSGKLNDLSINQQALSTLQSYSPKKLPQHYQLHIKELNQSIDSTFRFISRKLQHCPYEFYDRRYSNLQALVESRIEQALAQNPASSVVDKAKILEDTVNQAYLSISELAASYAARMEKAYGVEAIRRV